MKLYNKGDLVYCSNCGKPLFYVKEEVYFEEDVNNFKEKTLPVKSQKDLYEKEIMWGNACYNCGHQVYKSVLEHAKKKENKKKKTWLNIMKNLKNIIYNKE